MTSINNNIPTRTNYVPTTTQQPTNTTVTSSGVLSPDYSVPTPTSSVVYTASAPQTSDPTKLSELKRQIIHLETCIVETEAQISEYRSEISECRKLIRQAQEAMDRGELSDKGYRNVVKPLYEKMEDADKYLKGAIELASDYRRQYSSLRDEYYRLLRSPEPNLGTMTSYPPTVSGDVNYFATTNTASVVTTSSIVPSYEI